VQAGIATIRVLRLQALRRIWFSVASARSFWRCRHFAKSSSDEPPYKIEAGTFIFENVSGMSAAVDYFEALGRT